MLAADVLLDISLSVRPYEQRRHNFRFKEHRGDNFLRECFEPPSDSCDGNEKPYVHDLYLLRSEFRILSDYDMV